MLMFFTKVQHKILNSVKMNNIKDKNNLFNDIYLKYEKEFSKIQRYNTKIYFCANTYEYLDSGYHVITMYVLSKDKELENDIFYHFDCYIYSGEVYHIEKHYGTLAKDDFYLNLKPESNWLISKYDIN